MFLSAERGITVCSETFELKCLRVGLCNENEGSKYISSAQSGGKETVW